MEPGTPDLDTHFQLRTDQKDLEGTLRVGPKTPPELVSVGHLRLFLESKGVAQGLIDDAAVSALIDEVRASPGAEHGAVVARGKAARDGDRRRLEWIPEIDLQIRQIDDRRVALDEENKAPARKRAVKQTEEPISFYEQSAFVVVGAGQVLGSLTPPDAGEDGQDIYGNVLEAKQPPDTIELDPETIELTRDYRLVALIRGRLVYSGNKPRIEAALNVPGDVGFETGNIDFPGPVIIGGGVRDRFVVRSRETVTVSKLVEASMIHSRGDIVLDRGAAGREAGVLTCGQSLRAGYLEAVEVKCGRDCVVRHEITNCDVEARGMVQIPSGAIRGGVVAASMGIETGVAGSVQETRTEIVIGGLGELQALLVRARDRASETRGYLDQARGQLQMLLSASGGKLTPEQAEQKRAMQAGIETADRRMTDLREACERLEDNIRRATCPELRVAQCIYAGVVLWLPGYRATFRNEIKGESVVRLNGSGKPVIEYRGETVPLAKMAVLEPDSRVLQVPVLSEEGDDEGAGLAA